MSIIYLAILFAAGFILRALYLFQQLGNPERTDKRALVNQLILTAAVAFTAALLAGALVKMMNSEEIQ
jgi:heme A synthase